MLIDLNIAQLLHPDKVVLHNPINHNVDVVNTEIMKRRRIETYTNQHS